MRTGVIRQYTESTERSGMMVWAQVRNEEVRRRTGV